MIIINAPKTPYSVESSQSLRVPSVQQSQRATCGDQATRDPVAAMWKAQMHSGMQPTWFNGNPVDFPLFRDLRTDAQRVEYLPKFVTGEALEVVNGNRGCSFNDIMKNPWGTLWSDNKGNASMNRRSCSLSKADLWGLYWTWTLLQKSFKATLNVKQTSQQTSSILLAVFLMILSSNCKKKIVESGRSPRLKDIATLGTAQCSEAKYWSDTYLFFLVKTWPT